MTTTGDAGSGIASLRALVDEVESLPRAELLGLQKSVVAVRREADVLLARVAAEVARRSQPEPGAVGLSRREGFASPQALVASVSGGSSGEASRLARVGKVIADASRSRDTEQLATSTAYGANAGGGAPESDQPAAPVFPVLAEALSGGRLSVEVGDVIASALSRAADALDAASLSEWEHGVVGKAVGLPLMQVRTMVAFAEARITPTDLETQEEQAFHERFATMRPQPDGSMLLTARLDPVSAAPVRALIDGYVRDAFQKRRDGGTSDSSRPDSRVVTGHASATRTRKAIPDTTTGGDPAPTAAQLRADALAWLARHAASCEATHGGVKTTVIVRMSLDDLKTGEGIAKIDGAPAPVSVSAARQLAADASLIPAVLGERSEILDWGRERRLFTRAQRLALVERDGGCAKCHAPPDWCEAHHIDWWERDTGSTNLNNGILLCVRCHHDIHRDGWNIAIRGATVRITPPAHVDPARTPRVGGRARVRLAA